MRTDYGAAEDFWADPFNGEGVLIVDRADKRTWVRCDEAGNPVEECTLHYVDPLLEANRVAYNDSFGKRWGDGQVAASIPLDLYFRKIVPMKKAGDDAAIKRWLNDSDNRAFRTFKGHL